MASTVYLKAKGTHRCLWGHPWIYASEIGTIKGAAPSAKESVWVRDAQGRFIGSGLFSEKSEIRVRLFSREKLSFNRDLIQQRVRAAIARRPAKGCHRLIWSEADALPGLVVDRYDNIVVFQILHATIESWRKELIEILLAELRPETLIDRSDAPVRTLEGLPARVEVLQGKYETHSQHIIGAATFELTLLSGQKTGAYLDQAQNYQAVAAYAKGRRVLDCFANTGGFGIHCALSGAREMQCVESSSLAVEIGKRNANLNQVKIQWHEANVFDWLRQSVQKKQQFDLIILDPPSFTKSSARIQEALRGYREIHVRAFQLLAKGGLLATYCCSHHVSSAIFEQVIREAADDVRCQARMIHRQGPAFDHPVLLAMPESEYLKGVLVETF